MNTPSHAIINLAILGRRGDTRRNHAVLIGAILPDAPMFAFYIVAKFVYHQTESKIWSETYFQPFLQNIFDLFNSLPLALLGFAIAYLLHFNKMKTLCSSILLHSLLDFPLHSDDAHRHFFPFSNYRFISPISYWDAKRYGAVITLFEVVIILALSFRVFRLIGSRWGKGLLIAVNILYITGYILFYLR